MSSPYLLPASHRTSETPPGPYKKVFPQISLQMGLSRLPTASSTPASASLLPVHPTLTLQHLSSACEHDKEKVHWKTWLAPDPKLSIPFSLNYEIITPDFTVLQISCATKQHLCVFPISAWLCLEHPLPAHFYLQVQRQSSSAAFHPLQIEILVFIYSSLFAESPWRGEEVSFPGEGRWIESITTQRGLGCFSKFTIEDKLTKQIQTHPCLSVTVSKQSSQNTEQDPLFVVYQ